MVQSFNAQLNESQSFKNIEIYCTKIHYESERRQEPSLRLVAIISPENTKTCTKNKHRHLSADFVQLNVECGMPKRNAGKQHRQQRTRNASCVLNPMVYRSSYFRRRRRRWRQLVGCANDVVGILT